MLAVRRTELRSALMSTLILCSFLSNIANAAEECDKELPHSVRHVCGVLFDGRGGQVSNAELTLLQNGVLIDTVQTDPGRASFSFKKELAPGPYDLTINAAGYAPARFRIVVRKPLQKCSKRVLIITMPLGAGCGEIKSIPLRKN